MFIASFFIAIVCALILLVGLSAPPWAVILALWIVLLGCINVALLLDLQERIADIKNR